MHNHATALIKSRNLDVMRYHGALQLIGHMSIDAQSPHMMTGKGKTRVTFGNNLMHINNCFLT